MGRGQLSLMALVVVLGCGGSGGEEDSSPAPTASPDPAATPAPTSSPDASPEPSATPEATLADLRLELVASGLASPVFVTSAPDEADRLFVVEQSGTIRIVEDGEVRPDNFLDLRDVVEFGGELGMLGMAFPPDHAESGLFYVNYTDLDLVSVTSEFRVDPENPNRALRGEERVLLEVPQDTINHHGGMLAFGPDGALYLALGDSAQGADPAGYAQDGAEFRGKILRIDPAIFPEAIDGNPGFENPHVWQVGLRNPWRFSFDRETGDLYVGDVGEAEAEEVSVAPAGASGLNFGWNAMEGAQCFLAPWSDDPRPMCDMTGYTAPVLDYGRDDGCSVIGGYVFRGPGAPPLVGRYVFTDYCSARLFSFVWRDGEAVDPQEHSGLRGVLQAPSSFGEDADGNLYVVDLLGSIYRLTTNRGVASNPPPTP